MPQREWSRGQFLRRVRLLRADGFTPEEAWDVALWGQNLSHWVIRHLRQDRKKLVANWQGIGMSEGEITERLNRRYIDMGVRGQFEDEEWYVQRVGA